MWVAGAAECRQSTFIAASLQAKPKVLTKNPSIPWCQTCVVDVGQVAQLCHRRHPRVIAALRSAGIG